MRAFPLRTALTIAILSLILCAAPHVVRGLAAPGFAAVVAIAEFSPEMTPLSPLRTHPAQEALHAPWMPIVVPQILQDRNGSLDWFYAALWRTQRGEPLAITRILHYGDSPTTADLITGDSRQILQQRFGDAGHGFTLIGKPWAWYEHRGVELSSRGWQIDPGTRWDLRNGLFGLGGVVFYSGSTASSHITLVDRMQTHLEVWFLRQPDGGTITISSDSQQVGSIATGAASRGAGFARFDLKRGTGTLDLRAAGRVRLFGITLEKENAGVVYDSIGLNGASIAVPALIFNESHWAEELRHRKPDLVILNYGTNESGFASFLNHEYEKELREAIRRVRTALPDSSIMVMSPMDRGQRNGGEIKTLATIPRIVEIQRHVAGELGCGFFNTFEAMGGEGSMARWYDSQPRLVSADFTHPTPAGARIIAAAFVKELVAGFNRYRLQQLLRRNTTAGVH